MVASCSKGLIPFASLRSLGSTWERASDCRHEAGGLLHGQSRRRHRAWESPGAGWDERVRDERGPERWGVMCGAEQCLGVTSSDHVVKHSYSMYTRRSTCGAGEASAAAQRCARCVPHVGAAAC